MRRLVDGLSTVAGVLLLVVGVPVVLVQLGGWPPPHELPDPSRVSGPAAMHPALITVGFAAGWLAWAGLVGVVVVVRVVAVLRRLVSALPRLRLPGPLQTLSATVAGTIAVTTTAAGASAAPARAAATATVPTDHPSLTALQLSGPRPGAAAAADRVAVTVAAGGRLYGYVVHRHDTLWAIARVWLGDANRWPEIYHLNQARYDQHGRMRGGDHIEPGWTLLLPEDATPPAGVQPTGIRSAPPTPGGGNPTGPPAAPAAPAAPAPSAVGPALGSTSDSPGAVGVSVAPAGGTGPAPRAGSAHAAGTRSAARSGPVGVRTPARGVGLPGGGWVDAGLAAAIAAAAALVWIGRRRRYRPGPPTVDLRLEDPDLAPLPPIVAQVRRGLRTAVAAGRDAGHHGTGSDQTRAGDDLAELAGHGEILPDGGGDVDPDADIDPVGDVEFGSDVGFDGDADVDGAHPGGRDEAGDRDGGGWDELPGTGLVPVVPALGHPVLRVWPPAGLGLTGPGGQAAARGLLVAALSAGGGDEMARGRVVIPAATLATLIGAGDPPVGGLPRLMVATDLSEALQQLEAATLHRARLVYEQQVDTVTALRRADRAVDEVPPLLLIADAAQAADGGQRTRVAALLAQGQRLDIHGVLLGGWPDGSTVQVAADGATRRPPGQDRDGVDPAQVGRLAVIDAAQTVDLLRTLAQAHTGQPPSAPPADVSPPATAARATAADGENPTSAPPDRGQPNPVGPFTARDRAAGSSSRIEGEAWGVPATFQDGHPNELDSTVADGRHAARDGGQLAGLGRARVFLLGPPRVDDLPPPSHADPVLRPKSLELLVYLAAHGGRAGREQVLEDVLGEAPRSKAPGRLNTFVYSLRRSLKTAAGGRDGVYVGPPEDGYPLNRDLLDIDLWRMHAALTRAGATTDPAVRVAALREAVACYTGPLAQGRDYEWVEPYREAVRRQAIDAHVALAELLSASDPGEALTVLTAGIGHDPYNETLYQHAMRLHARLGNPGAIRELRETLTRRVGEIDTQPDPDTLALAEQLLTGLRGRRPVPGRAAA